MMPRFTLEAKATNRDQAYAWSRWDKHWNAESAKVFMANDRALQARLRRAEELNRKLKARLAA